MKSPQSSFAKRKTVHHGDSPTNELNQNTDTFGEAMQNKQRSYLEKIFSDFEQKKAYEEIVLKILNVFSLEKVTHPEDGAGFKREFRKGDSDKRGKTVFIDMDETLVNVQLFPQKEDSPMIEIEEPNGKIIKVRPLYI